MFARYSQREFPGAGHSWTQDAKTVRRSLPLGQKTWKGIFFFFFPPFPISQSFQAIKPQLHGQWASHKSSPLWVPLLTPCPGLGAAVRMRALRAAGMHLCPCIA